ncbi:MAG: 3-phosphoshikimate 1-carboxyvinyltransferase [Planctomycetota bacterium]|nr:MAG: 3-phosphoshikimate 1-carboxyvinyltransferase [Planctomycetota bacterium]
MSRVQIQPIAGPLDGAIRPPGSKSITNRAIVCAAFGDGTSHLEGVLDSEDTRVMMEAWRTVGVPVCHDPATATVEVVGCGGRLPVDRANLFIANSGTTIRFLTASLAACQGEFVLDGVERMRQRPIGDLLRALSELGADVHSLNDRAPDCPPVRVRARGLKGGRASVRGDISSQFLSGLMMAAPLAATPVDLRIEGRLVSVPYVQMTADVMKSFGVQVGVDLPQRIEIRAPQRYRAQRYAIEPDASAASYFWAAAAIVGGRARVEGLTGSSLQGDVAFCAVLERMGCTVKYLENAIEVVGPACHGIDVDMADISDTVQTLAAVALFVDEPTIIRGVAHNRVKETDRIGDLATELRRLGARVEELPDGLRIEPPSQIRPAEIQTYNDHRMAMSLALVGLRATGIVIRDPECTVKTYPGYWEDLQAFAGCSIQRIA